jgi:hypothetical protein
MNDETDTKTSAEPEAQAPAAPLSEDHAAALELASQAESPEDKAAAADLVSETAAQAEATTETVSGADPLGEANASAPQEPEAPTPAEPVKESVSDELLDILTTIEADIESLLHSPIALVAWVRSKVAEAKAKL